MSGRSVVGDVVRASLGNLIEYYDWFTYTVFTLSFAPVFFPAESPTAQLLNAAGIFAGGFFVRPLGGWVLGRYADRHGRRAAMTLSVVLMGGGSLLIAVLPGAATLGVLAPILLLVARLMQGLSLGGEYGAVSSYLSEVAPPGRRGFASSFQFVTLVGGQILALAVQLLLESTLSAEQLGSWGWRVAFGVGALASAGMLWARRGMAESPAVEASPAAHHGSMRVLLGHGRECLVVVGMTVGGTVSVYTFATYVPKLMVNTAGLPVDAVTRVSLLALLVFAALQPVLGALSDRLGRRPLLLVSGVGGTLLTVPAMVGIAHTTSVVVAFCLMTAGLVVVACYTSVSAVVKAELFPARIRALGVGLPYAVTVAVFGGTTQPLAFGLKEAGIESVYYVYVAGCALVSLIVYLATGETSHGSLLEHEHRAATAVSGASTP